MKKTQIALIIIVMIFTTGLTFFPAKTSSAVETYAVDFDLNDDGKVNIVDFILMKSAIINAETIGNIVPTAETALRLQKYMLSTEEIITTSEVTSITVPSETTSPSETTTEVEITTVATTTDKLPIHTVTQPEGQMKIDLNTEGKKINLSDLQFCEKYVMDEESITLINGNISYFSLYNEETISKEATFKNILMVDGTMFCIFSINDPIYKNYFIVPAKPEYIFNFSSSATWEKRYYSFHKVERNEFYDEFMKMFFNSMYNDLKDEKISFGNTEFIFQELSPERSFKMEMDVEEWMKDSDILLHTYDDEYGLIINIYASETGYYAQYIMY